MQNAKFGEVVSFLSDWAQYPDGSTVPPDRYKDLTEAYGTALQGLVPGIALKGQIGDAAQPAVTPDEAQQWKCFRAPPCPVGSPGRREAMEARLSLVLHSAQVCPVTSCVTPLVPEFQNNCCWQ
jgi:hypothetical protein